VSQPTRVPRGVESLIRSVAGGADEEDRDRRASTFARGLALGALVGAAIAGSTIWQRRLSRSSPRALRSGKIAATPTAAAAPEPVADNGPEPSAGGPADTAS